MAKRYIDGMKTTLNLNDALMREVKREAAKRGCTMGALVESALRRFLKETKKPPAKLPPLPTFHSGGYLVNIDSNAAIADALFDEEKFQRLYGREKPETK